MSSHHTSIEQPLNMPQVKPCVCVGDVSTPNVWKCSFWVDARVKSPEAGHVLPLRSYRFCTLIACNQGSTCLPHLHCVAFPAVLFCRCNRCVGQVVIGFKTRRLTKRSLHVCAYAQVNAEAPVWRFVTHC